MFLKNLWISSNPVLNYTLFSLKGLVWLATQENKCKQSPCSSLKKIYICIIIESYLICIKERLSSD